jgi:UDP-N-acetylglucosamine 2-epimerase
MKSSSSIRAELSLYAVVVVLLGLLLVVLPSTTVVEGGIFQGFNDEVPSIEEVTPTFEKIQRQLLAEVGITNEDDIKSIIDGGSDSESQQNQRRTQNGSGPEVSFMIVSIINTYCIDNVTTEKRKRQ